MRSLTEIPDELVRAVADAALTEEERRLLLDRRFAFYGDAERVVWSEIERQSRLAIVEENYFVTGSDLA